MRLAAAPGMVPEDPVKSRSQRRREHLALHALGEALVRLSHRHLDRMPLAEALRVAVQEARRLEGSAYRRHLRYVARLLSQGDPEGVRSAMEYVSDSGPAAGARRRRLEARRERLLAEGDAAIQTLVEERPGADRQRLRRMVRGARTERESGEESGRCARALIAYLRELDLVALSSAVPPVDEEP